MVRCVTVGPPNHTLAETTVTGRFDHVGKEGLDPKARLLIGFGHMNAYDSQIVLQSVSNVIAEPIDPARYRIRSETGPVTSRPSHEQNHSKFSKKGIP